jgi:hypothetical protein
MRRYCRPLLAAVLLGAVLALPTGARAQFRYGPNLGAGYGYNQTQAVAGAAAAGAAVGSRAGDFRYSPGGDGFGWGWPYPYQTPLNGFLTGSADIINATGQYEIQHQQANLSREQVKSAHIDNRRKQFDEAAYEKANTPTLWQRQAEDRFEQLQQARNNPPSSEIWEGISLNILLDDIRQIQASTGLQGIPIPIEPDMLKHISVITGNARRSSTMFNDGGKLKWPVELDDPKFDESRKSINTLFLQATQEASGTGLSGQTNRQLMAAIGQLKDGIDGAVNDMTPSDNIRAMTYANQVEASAKMLRDPNIAKQLGGESAPRGATVGELIANMDRNGQKFGPAGPADKPTYSSLYQSLLQYDLSLASMAQRASSPGMKQ